MTKYLRAALLSLFISMFCSKLWAANDVLAGTWRLIKFQSSSDEVGIKKPRDSSRFEMTLLEDGRVRAQFDCNRAFGQWNMSPSSSITNGSFIFGPMGGTKALCAPPNLDQFILAQFQYVRSYWLEDSRLYLSLMADGGSIEWERRSGTQAAPFKFVSPSEGGPRNWRVNTTSSGLNLRDNPSIDSGVIEVLPTGLALDNLGCSSIQIMTWCDVQTLGGGPRGWVAGDYLRPAVSKNGYVIFGVDESARRAGQQDFDATGQIECKETDSKPMSYCDFGVSRDGSGYATLEIRTQKGTARFVYFSLGRPIGSDVSEADYSGDFSYRELEDGFRIQIGQESFTIPEAVIFGG